MKIRVGTRKSKLALAQTEIFIAKLEHKLPEIECSIQPIVTTGDKILNKNLYDIGGKALFLKELEEKLLANEIDIAVHSLKDVPGRVIDGLEIAAVLERVDARDCFVSNNYSHIKELPYGAIIGTSSVRRKILINHYRPDIKITSFRGNVNNRMMKLKNGEVDGAILACAGLFRVKLFDETFCHPLTTEEMLPAAGQGTIALQIRSDDKRAREICNRINDGASWHLAMAERGFVSYLDATCRTPMAAYASYQGGKIKANYMLSDEEGRNVHFLNKLCAIEEAEECGKEAAKELLKLVEGK